MACPNGGIADNNNNCVAPTTTPPPTAQITTPSITTPSITTPPTATTLILQTAYGNIYYTTRTSSITITVKDITSDVGFVQIVNTSLQFQKSNYPNCFSNLMIPTGNSVTWTDYGVSSRTDLSEEFFNNVTGWGVLHYPTTTYSTNTGNIYSVNLPPNKEFIYNIDFYDKDFNALNPGYTPQQMRGFVNPMSVKLRTVDGPPEVLPPETNKCYSTSTATRTVSSRYQPPAPCTTDGDCDNCLCKIYPGNTTGYCADNTSIFEFIPHSINLRLSFMG